jgi:hypothetical protein
LIRNWIRNRNTVEFIGIWEQLNNPDFNTVEFDGFRKKAVSTSNLRVIYIKIIYIICHREHREHRDKKLCALCVLCGCHFCHLI